MSLREKVRAAVAARLDAEREEREARIRAEAYAAGRDAGLEVGRANPMLARAGVQLRPVPGVVVPCPNGRHAWDAGAHWCDCGALER